MRTLTKMFLLSCWCILSVSFAKETLDEIKANEIQQMIDLKLEILQTQNQETKEVIIEEEENSFGIHVGTEFTKEIPVPSNPEEDYSNQTLAPLSIEEIIQFKEEVKEEILAKGYTVEEYMEAVNADRISNQKEGAVSFDTYLEGLIAKEQATYLEYNLQPVENTEGTIKTDENSGIKVSGHFDPKVKDYIDQGLGRAENNIIIDSEGSGLRDGSITLTGADSYGDGWNGNELCVNGACYAVEGASGSWDLGVLASGDYAVSCGGGSWGSEVSWAFSDASGNELLSGSVGDYTLTVGDSGCADADAHSLSVGGGSWGSEVGWSIDGTNYSGSVGDFSLCLADGDYTFSMTDAYGDGWNGNTATISNADGDVVASGGLDSGDAGSFGFSIGVAPNPGCTDSEATNFNADANVDDGSCEYTCDWWLAGPSASCYTYVWSYGYTVEQMIGYGYECTCVEDPVLGCTDPDSGDYNADADLDDGSCTYTCADLTVDMADSYGDGWNGNVLTIGDQSFTLESGSAGQACADGGNDVVVTCGGGSWGSEVSWTISDADGTVLLSGGAPYEGVLNPTAPPTCDDESACNTGAEGDCEYADAGYNCDGSCADGYVNDCSGACVSEATALSYQGDGWCDDGSWGYELQCCDFNFDDGDCGAAMGCDGVAVDCGGAVNDDCGECGGDNSSCADCAGVANGDSFVDCADNCVAGSYLSWIGDGYCDDGSWGVDFVSCGDFNCDNGDCGTELIDGSCQSSGCSDSEFTCANGDCIPAGYYCDGSSEWGNAGWGPDCSDGSDELFDECCDAGAYADDLCNPPPTCSDYTWSCGGGSWGSEVSWTIDAGADALVASGSVGDGTFCAEDGDVTFSACDAYGDGWNGNAFVLSDADGNVVFSSDGPSSDLAAGECSAEALTLGGAPPVAGCTDAGAPNYNPDAEIDDGSCEAYCNADELYSCAYYLATGNYDCETLEGYGYDCSMCSDECPVLGCTDDTADNYNPDATMNDGSCDYGACGGLTVTMCDSYGDGWNGNLLTIGDASFEPASGDPCEDACYTGATDNVAVSCDGGSWQSEISWTLTDADGNEVLAGGAPYYGVLNPSGDVEGCTDPDADNYNPDATVDDGSCYTDTTCDDCVYDWTAYGAECCDAAWDTYAIDCATLEGTYGWDCSGCACPGDPVDPTCEDDGLVTCPDGSCANSADDCADCTSYSLVVGGGTHDGSLAGVPDIMAWEIVDPASGETLYTAGCDNPNYYGICEGGGSGTFDVCLVDGFYEFYGYSAWGIGWMGGTATFYTEDGEAASDPWTFEDSDWFPYGWGMGTTICLGAGCGCTFEGADNYDPDAWIDDNSSCIIQPGTDCESHSGVAGSFFGCGGTFDHCYTWADVEASAGDGSCNAHGAGC